MKNEVIFHTVCRPLDTITEWRACMMRNKKIRNISVVLLGILATMLLSCTLAFAQTSSDAKKIKDREKDGVLGPVKSVSFFWDGKPTPIWTRSYRNDGSLEMIEYNIGANPIIQTCDNKGRIVKVETLNQGKRELSSKSIYDDINHTETIYLQGSDHLPKEQSNKLTVDGKPLETIHYSPTGEYIGNTLFEYNEKGLLILMTKFSKRGIAFETYKTLYDLNGRIVESSRYDVKNYKDPMQSILAHKECYAYDAKGRLIERYIYNGASQEPNTITIYSDYDKYGNATKLTDVKRELYLDKFFPSVKLMKYEYY